jgi:hypothetical protein
MDDSWDWYDQTRKLLIAEFETGEIDYQEFVTKNQQALRRFLRNDSKMEIPKNNIFLTCKRTD